MHVPDGFISPKVYLPAAAVAAGAWAYGLRRVRKDLDEEAIPRIAVLTAFSFVLMMIMIPLPGGTSAHAAGVGILAALFGVWISFLVVSLVLFLQAILFGSGGITVLPVNALALGLAGSLAGAAAYRAFRPIREEAGLFAAGWFSVNLSAALLALVLGLQPVIAHGPSGDPLFFPFGLSITLPAVMIPHALLGVGEGILTIMVVRLFRKIGGKT
ncbi:MAG: energy-coupling factor ABC transporter permease [Candidatus Eisenbacteria bacterium]